MKQEINSGYYFTVEPREVGFDWSVLLKLWKKAGGRSTLVAEAKAPLKDRIKNYPYAISVYSGADDIEVDCVCDELLPTSPEVLEQINRAVRRH